MFTSLFILVKCAVYGVLANKIDVDWVDYIIDISTLCFNQAHASFPVL